AENPTFDRDELIALLQAEVDIDAGRTMDAETAREQFGTDEDG
ncbi:MAG: CopG family transcriptional regulator, partial [Halonotius sp.]